jgi:hypothetical protein
MAISRRELEATGIARAVSTARADARAADLAPIIADVQAAGARSLRAIAAGLNARGIRTPRGVGEWSGKQVGGCWRGYRVVPADKPCGARRLMLEWCQDADVLAMSHFPSSNEAAITRYYRLMPLLCATAVAHLIGR